MANPAAELGLPPATLSGPAAWDERDLADGIRATIACTPTLTAAGLDPSATIRLLAVGNNNLAFLVDMGKVRAVFRLRVDAGDAPDLLVRTREDFDSLKLLDSSNIAPKGLALDLSCSTLPLPFMVTEYVVGSPTCGDSLRRDSTLLRSLASAVGKLHRIAPPAGMRAGNSRGALESGIAYLGRHAANATLHSMIYETFARLERLGRPSEPPTLTPTHGNLWERNVINHKGHLRFIDFDAVALRDPAQELAHIWMDFSTGPGFSQAEIQEFRDAYSDGCMAVSLYERARSLMPWEVLSGLVRRMCRVLRLRRNRHRLIMPGQPTVEAQALEVGRFLARSIDAGVVPERYRSLDVPGLLSLGSSR